jgi:hypothetical protein
MANTFKTSGTGARGVAQVEKNLPINSKAQSSNLSTAKCGKNPLEHDQKTKPWGRRRRQEIN